MSAEEKSYETKRLRSSDLYKAAEAVSQLEALIGNSVSAKEQLIDNVRDGKLKVYARYRWTTRRLDRRKFLSTKPENVKHIRKVVDQRLFKGTENIIELIHEWDWTKGRFYLPRAPKGRRPYRIMLQDIRFKKDDVDLMAATWKRAIKSKADSGRKEEVEKWKDFTFALFEFARNAENFEPHIYKQEAFLYAFDQFLKESATQDKTLSIAVYRERLVRIYNKLKDQQGQAASSIVSVTSNELN